MAEPQRELVNEDAGLRDTISKTFARWRNIEDFLWPAFGAEVEFGELSDEHSWLRGDLLRFRVLVGRWLQASSLPVDQLVLTVAQDIFTEPVDVALAHKVAVLLRSASENHSDWRLPQFVEELRVISSNERRFIGFDDADAGYEPKPGVVTVATMHAAKGLEWDRVYLMAVSNYGFPSALPYDSYIGEKWYARATSGWQPTRLNLEAEVLSQLDALVGEQPDSYVEGDATLLARLDYASERLRLFYVALTRARREVIVTWNMGRYWTRGREQENQPALPLVALGEFAAREL
jgi:DNA helicase-2/ATP-dependent DNA helicase PcrA